MSEIIDEELPLSLITRLSPLNPRQETESDISMLAATIRAIGNVIPMLIRVTPGENSYEVLDGGRRWRAMRSLENPPEIVAVKIFKGSDAEARKAALVISATPKPLHPVEEFMAFSALAADGVDIPKIAHDFDLTERHVKQRLALGRLSPRVRALWRDGKISRDLAEVFTGGTIEAQDAVLDGCNDAPQLYFVRKALRREGVGAHEALAKFILGEPARRASYELLGGRIEESLFSEETILLDRTIAKNFVDGYLLEAAEEIMQQEGWGRAEIAGGADPDPLKIDRDYTIKERKRLETIEKQQARADAEDCAALEKEVEEIDLRALLRAIPKAQRATLGVRAELDSEGHLEIVRAVPQAEPEEEPEEEESDAPTFSRKKDGEIVKTRERGEPEPPAIPPAPGGKDAEWIIRDAIGGGLARATARNPYLALALATAALGCSHGCVGIGLRTTFDEPPEPPRHDLLQRLAPSHFLTALAIVATTPLADLTVAFAELVERAICFDDVKPAQLQNFVSLAQRLGAVRTDVAEALDHKALFQALSRDDALDAIRAIDGEAAAAEASKLRKPKIVERAAILAKDRKWLPEAAAVLFAGDAADTRSTAQAMVEAIESDEAAQGDGERRGDEIWSVAEDAPAEDAALAQLAWTKDVETFCLGSRSLPVLAKFLAERCYRDDEAKIYLSEFREALAEFGNGLDPHFALSAREQDAALADLGIKQKRIQGASHLIGLAIREDGEARRAAE